MNITANTRSIASKKVTMTFLIDTLTNGAVSYETRCSMPSGRVLPSSAMRSYTRRETATALAPGDNCTPIDADGVPLTLASTA